MACVMLQEPERPGLLQMKNGDKVIVGGSVNVYEKRRQYQLYAKEITWGWLI